MKKILIMLFLFAFSSSNKAQSNLPGKYKYNTSNDEKLLLKYMLNLNCDNTFLIEDSTINSFAKGTWKVQKDLKLILSIDTTMFNSKKSNKKIIIKYFIKNGELHEEVMTRRQYEKQNKKLDRQIRSCMPGMWEKYEIFEANQRNRYLLKVGSFSCE